MIFYRYCIPFVLGLTLVTGCRWGYQGEKVYPTEEIVAGETIGPEGGVIPFSYVDTDLSGLTVTVPPGALESPQELKVTVTTEQPSQDLKPYSPVIQFGPHGLVFREPILVKLPYEGDYATAVVYWSTDKEGVYELLEGVVFGNTIEVQVSHFSHAFVGHRNPCGQDLKNNKDNCGSCGHKCVGAHGLPSCREGVCQIDCEEGYTSCGETCCAGTETCFNGSCCTPDCTGKRCGSDGCGGTCGGCSALDDACNQGTCTSDGVCARVPRNENGVCDDGNSCTQIDACQQGECCPAPRNT